MSETPSATLDQQRAKHAWEAIQRICQWKESQRKDYAGQAKKLPIRLMTSGLGQALAFILAKANKNEKQDPCRQLHKDLTEWTLTHRKLPGKHPESLLKSICYGDAVFLRRATDEVLAYLEWLNRFAEAEGLTDGTE